MRIRNAIATLVAVVAIAVAGVSPALATDLHQPTPIEATQSSECQSGDVADGYTLWHFVLTQTEASQSSITVTFGYPAETYQYLSTKKTGGTLHFNVVRPTGEVLLDAYTAADGDLLNLSHTCIGGTTPSASPEPTPSPTPSPTPTPTPTASPQPSVTPSPTPSPEPTESPEPSATSTPTPSASPSATPSSEPSLPVPTMPPTDTAAGPVEAADAGFPLLALVGLAFALWAIVFRWHPQQNRR